MKVSSILPLAGLATAFVVPDVKVFEHLPIEPRGRQTAIQASWDTVKDSASSFKDSSASILDDAIDSAQHFESKVATTASDALTWGRSKSQDAWDVIDNFKKDHRGPPRHPHGPPSDDPHHGPPCHPGPPHHGPHHPHVDSNKTVYQLIADSKYTTKLAKLINDFPDLVEKLNGTQANYTVFAPTDKAFEKIPEHAPEPDKETLEKILSYHVSPDFYPARRIFNTHTLPTLLEGEHLSSSPRPQRLSINLGLRGLTVNFYSRIVAVDIVCFYSFFHSSVPTDTRAQFGSNGVIHGVDSLLLTPPNVIEIIDLLPSEFSTLELALSKTGLLDHLNSTDHPGDTFFAPSNFAFKKLGPKVNMFLFSKHGQKYLKALLLYHVATGTTLYSDAAYVADEQKAHSNYPLDLVSEYSFLNNHNANYKREARKPFNAQAFEAHSKRSIIGDDDDNENEQHGSDSPHHGKPRVPKGYHHYDLPTMLHDQKLNVDVVRYGPFVGMKVNGFSRVVIQDGIAQDGVIQVVSDVLIPPHGDSMSRDETERSEAPAGWGAPLRKIKSVLGFGGARQMSVCEFKARFKGLVDDE